MWKEAHVNWFRLLHKDSPDPLSLFISHKMSIPTGLCSLILLPLQQKNILKDTIAQKQQ